MIAAACSAAHPRAGCQQHAGSLPLAAAQQEHDNDNDEEKADGASADIETAGENGDHEMHGDVFEFERRRIRPPFVPKITRSAGLRKWGQTRMVLS